MAHVYLPQTGRGLAHHVEGVARVQATVDSGYVVHQQRSIFHQNHTLAHKILLTCEVQRLYIALIH